MKGDKLKCKILPDGTVEIKACDISPANRVSAESFIARLATRLGGEWTVARSAKDPQAGTEQSEQPRLDFFRKVPSGAEVHPPLVSSIQSLETCFSLIAFERYPHALISCAAAIESVLKAKLKIPPQDLITFNELLNQIGVQYCNLAFPVNQGLRAFREARNSFTHFGFNPRDDDTSVGLLLQVGFPYLKKCYRELFGLYLDYREISPADKHIKDLSKNELASVGLSPQTADHMRIALQVHQKVIAFNRKPAKYCISTFAQYLAYVIKSFHTTADAEHPESFYGCFSVRVSEESMTEAVRCAWRAELQNCVRFDCSVCGGHQTLVAQCDERSLREGIVRVRRAMCVRCGLSIPPERPFLADVFLQEQIEANRHKILRAS